MDTNVRAFALLGSSASHGEVALLLAVGRSGYGGDAISGLNLLVGVVDEILFHSRHVGGSGWRELRVV